MGVRHKEYAVEGVQFHPEALLTEYGHDMLNNFLSNFKTSNRKKSDVMPSEALQTAFSSEY